MPLQLPPVGLGGGCSAPGNPQSRRSETPGLDEMSGGLRGRRPVAADGLLGGRRGPPTRLLCSPSCLLAVCLPSFPGAGPPWFSSPLMKNTKGKCASAQVWGAPARGMEK